MDQIYTTDTAAETLGSNKQTVAKLCRDGSIKAYKQLGKWFILHSDLIEWIRAGRL